MQSVRRLISRFVLRAALTPLPSLMLYPKSQKKGGSMKGGCSAHKQKWGPERRMLEAAFSSPSGCHAGCGLQLSRETSAAIQDACTLSAVVARLLRALAPTLV